MAKYQEWITEEGLLKIEAWARDGLTDEQIAKNIGIIRTTLYDWKKKHQNISDALKRGKEVVDIQVENALLKRAIGYNYNETTIDVYNRDGKKEIHKRTVTKHVAGDTTAQIFWLKNRKPEAWRDKRLIIDESGKFEENGLIDAIKNSANDDWKDIDFNFEDDINGTDSVSEEPQESTI